MKQVYVLMTHLPYEGDWCSGIFSTFDLAIKQGEKIMGESNYDDLWASVHKTEIDSNINSINNSEESYDITRNQHGKIVVKKSY